MPRLKPPGAVYIHIPFCDHKCYYCDFNTYVVHGQPVNSYLEALEREMEATVREVPPQSIKTIFIGGGTPTILTPEQMEVMLNLIKQYFPDWDHDIEFTMEANPGTTDVDKLQVMKEGGINRISFGAQAFHNGLLSAIGRVHRKEDVLQSIELARSLGFENLSIDLMFGLPHQTLSHMEQSLEEAQQLRLPHLSVYSLKVEENTLFHTWYLQDRLPLPTEDEEFQMYTMTMQRLKEAGYKHYEISNFARPGYESRHNQIYWRNQSYYGIGAGAHGYVNGVRHVNIKGVREYIEATKSGLPRLEERRVPLQEAMEDFMIVGLRLLDGVRSRDFQEQFHCQIEEVFSSAIEKCLDKRLIEPTNDGYRLTQQGILLGNEVFAEFISLE